MSGNDDGGPAFPINSPSGTPAYMPMRDGMTLRDWFAGQALVGLSANPALARCVADTANEANLGESIVLSRVAFEFADAMLAARKKDGGGT